MNSIVSPVGTPKPFLKANGLNLRIGHAWVTDALNLEIHPGEMIAILGKNGIGKSTLLYNLAGLPRGDVTGSIRLKDKTYAEWGEKASACWRGLLAQKQQDQFSATVLETVLTGRHPHLGRWAWETVEDKAIALEALRQVGMSDFAVRDIVTLSGGERQRVALATILTQNPTLYFMDEPLTHLDLNHQMELLKLMQARTRDQRASSVMVLHEPGLAYRFCDSALLLFGQGEWLYGSVDSVLTVDNLSRLYGYPLVQIDRPNATGTLQRCFVPA